MKTLEKAISLVQDVLKRFDNSGTEYKVEKALFSVERHCGKWMWKFKAYRKSRDDTCSKHKTYTWGRVYKDYYVCKCEHCEYLYIYHHMTL